MRYLEDDYVSSFLLGSTSYGADEYICPGTRMLYYFMWIFMPWLSVYIELINDLSDDNAKSLGIST